MPRLYNVFGIMAMQLCKFHATAPAEARRRQDPPCGQAGRRQLTDLGTLDAAPFLYIREGISTNMSIEGQSSLAAIGAGWIPSTGGCTEACSKRSPGPPARPWCRARNGFQQSVGKE